MGTGSKDTDKKVSLILVVLALLTAQILPIINTLTEDYSIGDETPEDVYFTTLGSLVLIVIPSALFALHLFMWAVKTMNKRRETRNTKDE